MPATRATRRSHARARRARAHAPTSRQTALLRGLCDELGLPPVPVVSKSEASQEIAYLLTAKQAITHHHTLKKRRFVPTTTAKSEN